MKNINNTALGSNSGFAVANGSGMVSGTTSGGGLGGLIPSTSTTGTAGSYYLATCPCTCGGCAGNTCTCGGCTCNNVTWANPPTSSSTISLGTPAVPKSYSIFKLPKEKKGRMPNKVYASGRLITIGIFGSDVQAAFTGKELIFAQGELGFSYNNKSTVSLDYGDWMYHYNLKITVFGSEPVYEDDSNIVKTKLVSKVKQQ